MTITLTTATVPVFKTVLNNLSHCLNQATAHAEQRGFSPDAFVLQRLAPDMLPLASQIRIACDAAKNGTARVAGIEAPKFADDESTMVELQARIGKTLAWLESVPEGALDGREEQVVTFPVGKDQTKSLAGEAYVKHVVLPNFYFHAVTAYNLLRHSGVALGKMDYLVGARS